MKSKVIVIVLLLINVPAGIAGVEAVSYYFANRSSHTMTFSGREREYSLHVPNSYDPARPTPLVISMHGASLWPAGHMRITKWNEVADEQGFIVVYPSAVRGEGPAVWHAMPTPEIGTDVRFIADLIDTLKASYNIDPARIYADGLSNGGGMAFVLSCALSDRVAAVGIVGSAQLLPFAFCKDRPPVPVIAIHGAADPLTKYHGGKTWAMNQTFPDIPDFVASWAKRNQCAPEPVRSAVNADVTLESYTGCATGADVVFYTVHGGGHTWPGGERLPEWFGGRTAQSLNASRIMWDFFRRHALTGRGEVMNHELR